MLEGSRNSDWIVRAYDESVEIPAGEDVLHLVVLEFRVELAIEDRGFHARGGGAFLDSFVDRLVEAVLG